MGKDKMEPLLSNVFIFFFLIKRNPAFLEQSDK